ncbi:MAG: hypothetical protein ACOYKH_06985 [Brevefilum fermentans]|nr:hypothetical protein [Brevefilum fermentans]
MSNLAGGSASFSADGRFFLKPGHPWQNESSASHHGKQLPDPDQVKTA